MERLEYHSYGGPHVVRLASFRPQPPQGREILVRVMAASINPMDWKIRNGDMKAMTGSTFPRGLGTDFAGIVEAVGPQVEHFSTGQEVLGTVTMKRSGAFAHRVITSEELIVTKPRSLSFASAATLPIAATTAWHALVKTAHVHEGQRVFINGASGAVGQAAIAIARSMHADVVGRVGTGMVERAGLLGLTRAVDYNQPLPADLDHSFDVVFDTHGSLSITAGDRLIKRGGMVIDIVPTRSKFIRALVSRRRKFLFADVKRANLQKVVDLAATGKLHIPIIQSISLSEVPHIMATLENGQRVHGKVVIDMHDS